MAYAITAALPGDSGGENPLAQARLEVEICGDPQELPEVETELSQGQLTFDGESLIEFPGDSGVTLGHVFDAMNRTLTETELMGYKNDNMCNTSYSNEVSVSRGRFLEGREEEPVRSIDQYENYQLRHGDYIIIRYD
ncbi:MAG: hypothetical protein ACLFM9_02840 [Candidatus Aenigmatarchaeota archaeon]